MTIYVLSGFNNYYNRQVKKFDTINEYEPYILHTQQNFNFVPNDGVNTQVVLGSNVNNYNGTGDYLIVVNDFNEIVSRWFIIESARDRAGQFTLTLHRDLVVDHYDELLDAPMFIEKATLSDSDSLIYNSENMTFNQIKQSETLLKDETNSAWIVGYMSSKPYNDGQGDQDKISSEIKYHLPVNKSYPSLSNFELYQYSNLAPSSQRDTLYSNPSDVVTCVWIQTGLGTDGFYHGRKYAFNDSGNQNTGILDKSGYSADIRQIDLITGDFDENYQCPPNAGSSMIYQNSLVADSTYSQVNTLKYLKRGYSAVDSESGKTYNQLIAQQLLDQVPSISEEQINQYQGWTIYTEDTNKYYKISISSVDQNRTEILPNFNGNLWTTMKQGYDKTVQIYSEDPYYSFDPTWADFTGITAQPNSYSFSVNFLAQQYEVTITEQAEPSLTYKIEIDNDRYHLNDAPYDMFCIPYSDDLIINKFNSFYVQANKELAFQTALALGRDYIGAGYIYDIQLLPYCPFRSCIKEDGTFDIDTVSVYDIEALREDQSYGNGEVVGVVLFGTESNFSFDIQKSIQLTNKKIQSECDVYRLCSPNYSGLFEFNVAKNDGVQYLNVDCTYKPYNPYIHINPNFQNMYGYDANDMRGLVCGGDFSLPQITDAWKTYELNNKNYQEIFDRNIQSMELKNRIERDQQVFNAITGTLMGGAAGATVGSKAGPYGAIAGGIIGTATSAVGGALDVYYGDQLRAEALDYTKDMFGYQLGNIQALPYSLAKTSAFTANNKIWPFIEHYTCTETEKRALANKIAYNGMTVMRIGTMSEFIDNSWSYNEIESKGYIKGKLIRLETVNDDYHIVNALSGELDKGVYIK